jgi:hypothetical protein
MTYKYDMPTDQNNLLQPGHLQVYLAHSRACWSVLKHHAESGHCTCAIDKTGIIHILAGCVTGRAAKEEYDISLKRIEEYKKGVENET